MIIVPDGVLISNFNNMVLIFPSHYATHFSLPKYTQSKNSIQIYPIYSIAYSPYIFFLPGILLVSNPIPNFKHKKHWLHITGTAQAPCYCIISWWICFLIMWHWVNLKGRYQHIGLVLEPIKWYSNQEISVLVLDFILLVCICEARAYS